jgi:YidC/Oxa1 family membrane protein insertase
MQALSPKIKDIQAKYKDNPTKMNAEMAELYKREGYNPMSGCLPMLIQIPIFFAMYNLFNNHFDLRGAMFIPGWIPDLSIPETIWNFAPFRLPILGWSDLRLLPFIYLFSQLLYGKVTQTPDQQGNAQMKMMLYMMPIMFFFILYDVPAGLLLYWIMSNVLTLVQQIIINKYLAQKKAHMAATSEPVIAPRRKKK